MARPDKVYSRFRGVVAANLTGVWGTDAAPELINVTTDASGLLIAAGQGLALGVIWTPEGKSDPAVANYNVALAGSVMTVFVCAELVGDFTENTSAASLEVGEGVWSVASGSVDDAAPGAGVVQKIGHMVASDEGAPRLFLNVAF
jgi:hypothetical protein